MANEIYRQSLRAGLDLDEAMDHIDQIYSAQILGIYGATLALGVSTAEFDQMMSLTPKPPAGTDSIFLEVFISVLEHVPIAGEAYEGAKIAGEAAHHIADVLKRTQGAANAVTEVSKHFQEDGRQLDSLEPDEDAMKIIRSRSAKTPLFQQILWMRYQVEYDRRAARAMSASWLILDGLNQPQWDYIYRLFGKKVDKRMEAIRRIHTVLIIANTFADIMGIRMNPIAVQEPILGGVEDLYRFWGARLFRTEHWWYGKTDGFLVPIGQANPVQ